MSYEYFGTLFKSEHQSNCTVQFCCTNTCPISERQAEPDRTSAGPSTSQKLPDRTRGAAAAESEVAAPSSARPIKMKFKISRLPTKRQEVKVTVSSKPLPADTGLLGDPLPAHLLILCGGSPLFRAHVERWMQQGGNDSKPVVMVSLKKAEDHPHALAALRFMYTNQLDAGADVATLLLVRRQAGYFDVKGCKDACDKALLESIAAPAASSQIQQQLRGALAGVMQLYRDKEFLADVEEPIFCSLLRSCRKQLATYAGSVSESQAAAVPRGGPSLGQLLAWAFKDAPFLLSDPEALEWMKALPLTAMEALLSCGSFATDSESTVLVVLKHWLVANPVDKAIKQRLMKLVRLCQLRTEYLLRVLPLMKGWAIGEERQFLQDFALANEVKRNLMKQSTQYDMTSGWYQTVPRPTASVAWTYEWSVDAAQLQAALGSEPPATLNVNGTFSNGSACVIRNGFEFRPSVELDADAVGVYLLCTAPACLPPSLSSEDDLVMVNPGPCRLVLYKWVGGGAHREEAWSCRYGPEDYIEVGADAGQREAVSLAAPGSSASGAFLTSPAAQRLAALEQYVKDGKLWGAFECRGG